MKINKQYVNFTPKSDLEELIEKKINKLDTFYSKILGCDLFMKVDNPNKKDNKTIELKIKISKNQFMVKKTDDSFERALTFAVESMERILKKENQKESDKNIDKNALYEDK